MLDMYLTYVSTPLQDLVRACRLAALESESGHQPKDGEINIT